MNYLANYTRGRCPECQQPMLYISGSSGSQPGMWYHASTGDRDSCPDGDGRY